MGAYTENDEKLDAIIQRIPFMHRPYHAEVLRQVIASGVYSHNPYFGANKALDDLANELERLR
jgi:hypothetical protein